MASYQYDAKKRAARFHFRHKGRQLNRIEKIKSVVTAGPIKAHPSAIVSHEPEITANGSYRFTDGDHP